MFKIFFIGLQSKEQFNTKENLSKPLVVIKEGFSIYCDETAAINSITQKKTSMLQESQTKLVSNEAKATTRVDTLVKIGNEDFSIFCDESSQAANKQTEQIVKDKKELINSASGDRSNKILNEFEYRSPLQTSKLKPSQIPTSVNNLLIFIVVLF